MFGRKNKPSVEQGRGRQPRYDGARPTNPAFSYYTNRPIETPVRRVPGRQGLDEQPGKSTVRQPFTWTQIPFWLLVAVAVVCIIKLLFLSTDPKVIVMGQSAVSGTYLQSASTYSAAAHKLLAASITNHTKLTANLDGTAIQLQQEFPELQNVSVTVPLIGNRPLVYVQVAQPTLILQNVHGNYALNSSGIVLAKLKTVPENIPTVTDQSGATPQPGKQYLSGSTISFIQTLAYQFKTAHMVVATYVLPSASPYELDIRLEGKNFVVKCNLQEDPLVQSGAVIATLQHLGATTPAVYLDARTPGRVYYK